MLEVINDSQILVKAELDMQITTARAFPRKVENSISEAIALVKMDEETASACFYVLARKNKDGEIKEIKGPSIRLAEIMAATWGNLHAATRIVENDGKFITAQAVAWDLEKNVKMTSEVKKSIQYSKGGTYSADMQSVAANAACAIALRNAIFKVIPKAIVDKAYNEAVKFAVGDQKTLRERVNRVLSKFNSMGISQQKIFDFFNKKTPEEFTIENLENLIGIGTSIKEGYLKIDEAFVITDEMQEMSAKDRVQHLLKNKELTNEKTNN